MSYEIEILDDICITRYFGVLDDATFLAARKERREMGHVASHRKFVLDFSTIEKFDANFSLHRRLANEDSARLNANSKRGAAQICVSHVIDRNRFPALYGDVRAWQNMMNPQHVSAEIHESLDQAVDWLRTMRLVDQC